MACQICGRNSCTRSFHSLEEQAQFDEIADPVIERVKGELIRQVERLQLHDVEEMPYLVSLEDVVNLIKGYS